MSSCLLTIKNLFRLTSTDLLSLAVLAVIFWATVLLGGYGLNKMQAQMYTNMFPGCEVIDKSGDVLTIRLADHLASGSDGACQAAAQVIFKVARTGYNVKVANWHTDRVFDLVSAQEMAEFQGAY